MRRDSFLDNLNGGGEGRVGMEEESAYSEYNHTGSSPILGVLDEGMKFLPFAKKTDSKLNNRLIL